MERIPQLGQMCWGSVLMELTVLWPQIESKATPHSAEWCEIGQRHPWPNDGLAVATASVAVDQAVQPVQASEGRNRQIGAGEATLIDGNQVQQEMRQIAR
jgi:hypothetical protein